MKLLRLTLAIALTVAVGLVIAKWMVPRIQCNSVKGVVNRNVRSFSRINSEFDRLTLARRNLDRLQPFIDRFPEDYQLYILRGANLRILQRPDEAIAAFRQALALVERAEIYAQIGEIEIERGNVAAGRQALIKAATFNIIYVETVESPLRDEIYQAAYARHARLRAAKR